MRSIIYARKGGIGGGGGGNDNFAQAGGKKVDGFNDAVEQARKIVSESAK